MRTPLGWGHPCSGNFEPFVGAVLPARAILRKLANKDFVMARVVDPILSRPAVGFRTARCAIALRQRSDNIPIRSHELSVFRPCIRRFSRGPSRSNGQHCKSDAYKRELGQTFQSHENPLGSRTAACLDHRPSPLDGLHVVSGPLELAPNVGSFQWSSCSASTTGQLRPQQNRGLLRSLRLVRGFPRGERQKLPMYKLFRSLPGDAMRRVNDPRL